MEPTTSNYSKLKSYFVSQIKNKKRMAYLGVSFFVFVCLYLFLHTPPKDFPVGQVFTIEQGQSLQSITNALYESHIIKSPFAFRTHVIIAGGEKKVKAGDYLLDTKEGPADLAYRFVHGEYHLVVTKITIPEGWNVFQIGDYLQKTLINFDKASFLKLSKSHEGYLFPDTYFVSPAISPARIIERMQNNFLLKKEGITGLATTTYAFKDIVIMASILEEEARTTESRRIIAGILWKRLKLGMPLQVDSTFSYINGKNTYELTLSDLQIDSPYNTYRYKGLPPGPIGNPGIDAIESAMNPTVTKYLYFLSSRSGKMYYATTFEQHKRNKELYLNK